jgi:hypothetical protein
MNGDERERAKAEALATRKLVCECACDDPECPREWWAPANTANQHVEWDCDRMTLRAEPDGRVVCIARHDVVEADEGGEPDAGDLTRL